MLDACLPHKDCCASSMTYYSFFQTKTKKMFQQHKLDLPHQCHTCHRDFLSWDQDRYDESYSEEEDDEAEHDNYVVNDSDIRTNWLHLGKSQLREDKTAERSATESSSTRTAEEFYHNRLKGDLLKCPLTGAPFVNPVIASDSITYEELAISTWFLQHDVSPVLGVRLAHKRLVKNRTINHAVAELSTNKNKSLKSSGLV